MGIAQTAEEEYEITVDELGDDSDEKASFLSGLADSAKDTGSKLHSMGQMGAKRIGSLAIGIGVVGIVLNQLSDLGIVANSTGVIDVSGIFQTAGAGLNLLVVGVIIAAAAVLLSLWSGF